MAVLWTPQSRLVSRKAEQARPAHVNYVPDCAELPEQARSVHVSHALDRSTGVAAEASACDSCVGHCKQAGPRG